MKFALLLVLLFWDIKFCWKGWLCADIKGRIMFSPVLLLYQIYINFSESLSLMYYCLLMCWSNCSWIRWSYSTYGYPLFFLPMLWTCAWCKLLLPRYRNVSWQSPIPHLNGFCLVWVKSCSMRYYWSAKPLPHLLQTQSFWVLWIFMCLLRLYLVLKILSQLRTSHRNFLVGVVFLDLIGETADSILLMGLSSWIG